MTFTALVLFFVHFSSATTAFPEVTLPVSHSTCPTSVSKFLNTNLPNDFPTSGEYDKTGLTGSEPGTGSSADIRFMEKGLHNPDVRQKPQPTIPNSSVKREICVEKGELNAELSGIAADADKLINSFALKLSTADRMLKQEQRWEEIGKTNYRSEVSQPPQQTKSLAGRPTEQHADKSTVCHIKKQRRTRGKEPVSGPELSYFDEKTLHIKAEALEACKKIDSMMAQKKIEIQRLYSHGCRSTSSGKTINGLPVIIMEAPESLPDGGKHYNANIKLLLRATLQFCSARECIKPFFVKISFIQGALYACHARFCEKGLVHLLGENSEDLDGLLGWYYGLIFEDTSEHLPLLGPARLTPQKTFSEAQVVLYNALLDPPRISVSKACQAALELMEIRYQEALSKLSLPHIPISFQDCKELACKVLCS
ncbi:hypothetical protein PtA15_3A671 [Puccinia triticina]|uniref:Uncharacterized protein n=1 Tax=Puccinia triticina TaxID=208348 RepID=A0ABY7CFN5_9BASI|nr:uncharacterized protein PtA15_3A671 [Puccinia triticina]WAQ83302.1 hypothetical protein PtA15_3A671 [Puccinia triticina]